MKRLVFLCLVLLSLNSVDAHAATIDMVTIGNPGNAPDTRYVATGIGSVDHVYRIGKYEVTAGQYTEFLNAVAQADPNFLYNTNMAILANKGANIVRTGASPNFSYSVDADWADRPVNIVSFWDAARFANWLHNGQPTGPQGPGTTEDGAYHNVGNDALFGRNPGARYFIPNANEWYKAAFHDKTAGLAASYFDFPTRSNTAPGTDVAEATNPGSNANHSDVSPQGAPYYRTVVGEYELSASPYGTFDQAGNVYEWSETEVPFPFGSTRELRGGSFYDGFSVLSPSATLRASNQSFNTPTSHFNNVGFRLASSVPEPSTLLLGFAAGAAIVVRWRYRRARRFLSSGTVACLAAALVGLPAQSARADVFQWEYISPGDPGQGKQQSATLAPDGAGVNAEPYANLYSRNLTKAYLIGADLPYAFGDDSNLTEADFSTANLSSARFYRGNLTNANFSQANARFSEFNNATLTGAVFTGANVQGANFFRDDASGGTGITPAQLASTASYAAHELSYVDPIEPSFVIGINLGGNNLANVNLVGQNLRNADLSFATLTDANLSQANLEGAYLWTANLTGANFNQANLTGVYITESDLTNADLSQANLSYANFSGAMLTGATFTGAEVRSAAFDGSGLTPAQLYSTASYLAHDLTGTSLGGLNLTNGNFAAVNLANASFNGAILAGADFAGADVRGANFGGSDLTLAQLESTASYVAHDMSGIKLDNFNFTSVNLASQNLTGSSFNSATLTGANLSQANASNSSFQSANLTNANLNHANFSYAYLGSATLTGADVRGANFSHPYPDPYDGSTISAAQLASTASYLAHDLTEMILDGNNLSFADLTGQNLTDASLVGARLGQLAGANLTRANLTQASFSSASLNNAILTQANLTQAGFSYSTLIGANLTQANLTNAVMYRATLTNANFSQANLSGANMAAGKFTGVILTGAEVRGANFSKYDSDYSYDGYVGTGITAAQLTSTASYAAHDLTGINVGGSNLASINLAGQNLTGAVFARAILTNANLSQANLTGAMFWNGTVGGTGANLTGANLTGANLTNAEFVQCTLTSANFTGAEVRGAHFTDTGLTLGQLYSTASYVAHDLTGLQVVIISASNANFAGQNLTDGFLAGTFNDANFSAANVTNGELGGSFTNANFSAANLTNAHINSTAYGDNQLAGADFTGAEVRGASFLDALSLPQLYSTASYLAHDLTGISFTRSNFTNGIFTGQNLTDAAIEFATLTGADFSGATVRGADFGLGYDYDGSNFILVGTGLSPSQLASTASYLAHDLSGINLWYNSLPGIDLSAQNLSNAELLGTILTNANLSHANLADSQLSNSVLGGANLSAADTRGASYLDFTGAVVTNLIRPDGQINGLNLGAGQSLVVRDDDGDPYYAQPPIPIHVNQHLVMGSGGTLRTVFEADAWDSTISFAAGVPVSLGGTLELTFASGVDLAGQLGRAFDVFDWAGVSPTGAFSVVSPYWWDLSQLSTTGDVTLLPDADFSGNGVVDAADLAAWKLFAGLASGATNAQGDADYDGDVDGGDFLTWQRMLGATNLTTALASAVPEPSMLALAIAGFCTALARPWPSRLR